MKRAQTESSYPVNSFFNYLRRLVSFLIKYFLIKYTASMDTCNYDSSHATYSPRSFKKFKGTEAQLQTVIYLKFGFIV